MQLERLLQSQGFGSRKQCRSLIETGRVAIAGQVADNPRQDVDTDDLVFSVDGEDWRYRQQVVIMLHKPPGFECSRSPQHHASVLSLLPIPLRERGVQPVGRLDQDTTGLLLLTDDGPLNHALTHPRRHVPKTYRVTTARPITETQCAELLAGVMLHGEPLPLAALVAQAVAECELRLTISQGIYHQVKRMLAAVGNHVLALHRESMGGMDLGGLPVGQWRYLDGSDLARIRGEAQLPLA